MKEILLYSMQYVLLIFIIILIIKIIIGPTRLMRIISLMVLSSVILALLVLYALVSEIVLYVDVALVYDIFGFLGLLAIARFLPRSIKEDKEEKRDDS